MAIDYQPWIGGRPIDEMTPREIEGYCKDHLGLTFEGRGPDDLPFKTVARIISQYLVECGTWNSQETPSRASLMNDAIALAERMLASHGPEFIGIVVGVMQNYAERPDPRNLEVKS